MTQTLSKTLAEYIWIDGFGTLRSKTKVLDSELIMDSSNILNKLPEWNFDGSSTGQAPGNDSEVLIRPVFVCNDPFRKNGSLLVLCDTWLPSGEPHLTNMRSKALDIFNRSPQLAPRFGMEQEFFLVKPSMEDGKKYIPIGFQEGKVPRPQKYYYCGVGGGNAIGRMCIEEAFRNAIFAGLSVTGLNAEVAPSQWEIQVCTNGIEAADQLWMLRYILNRTAEMYGWNIDYHPKPLSGDWNGSGCHVNFSTLPMREEGGYNIILEAIDRLSKRHTYHMDNYGSDNKLRMTGHHETASYDTFSYGVANRGCSVRIPRTTEKNHRGYFEDRRPASNMDPYIVTSLIFETTSLNQM